MKNLSKVLAIASFMVFGLLTSLTSFPQSINAAPPGNPPGANVTPTFNGLTVTGGTTTLGTLNAGATTLSSGTVSNNLSVTGTTTSGNLSTGGNLNVTGTSTLSGNLNLAGVLQNTTSPCYLGICLDYPITISDGLTISGNTLNSGNLTVNGNTSIKGNTTLGDASTDTVTVNGTQKTTQDIKSDRFIRAKVDANGMGGIGRFYNKSQIYSIPAGGNFNYSAACDTNDWVVSCNGGWLSAGSVGANFIINGVWRSGRSSCEMKGRNQSAASADVTIQLICYAPDENWYYDNGTWRIMSYDGTLSAPIGL